jgi:proteasome accessory factor B
MKCRLQLPIEYDERQYGYYYSRPVEQFPGVRITEPELFALLVAKKAIVQYHGTPFEHPLETAFRKLTAQLSPDSEYTFHNLEQALSFRPLGPEDTDLELFQRLNAALRERRVLRFKYRKLGATKAQTRRVDPYHVACVDNRWYLFAYDRARKAMRTFALSRMHRPVLTKDRFERSAKFDPDEYLRGSFGVFKGNDDFEVVLEFDAWAADLLRGRRWHPSEKVVEFPKGGLRMWLQLNNSEEIERWVLSWGKHATVIRPVMLAKRIEQTAAEILRKNEGADEESGAHTPQAPTAVAELVQSQGRGCQRRRRGFEQQTQSGDQTLVPIPQLSGDGIGLASQPRPAPGTRIYPQILLTRQVFFAPWRVSSQRQSWKASWHKRLKFS